jgi:poly(A)-specific ribonuclease
LYPSGTRSNFFEQSNDFIRHLPNASWIAIDEEMTGISLPPGHAGQRELSKSESPQDRYASLKHVPERYSIIQLGVCLFEQKSVTESPTADSSAFVVRKYKFTLFPPADPNSTREVTMNPSAMHFLQENNMNFDLWVREGIPFCTRPMAEKAMAQFLEREEKRNKLPEPIPASNRKRVVLTREEDKQFHARCMTRLREWLDTPLMRPPVNGEGVSILLPRCNSFLRRSIYEAVERDYPYLVCETDNEQIRVWRLTDEERARRNQRLVVEEYHKFVTETIGCYRIFMALTKACSGEPILNAFEQSILAPNANAAVSEFVPGKYLSTRKIPLVIHYGLMDLLFLLTHFHSPTLPGDWNDCKRAIHSFFPVIYDTKVLASEYCTNEVRRQTGLQTVYEETLEKYPEWRDASQLTGQVHDAAHDAFMTGVCFCGLSYTIHNECQVPPEKSNARFALWEISSELDFPRWLYARNKLYFHLSPYTIDLESPQSDPLGRGLSHISTFSVSNIDPRVTSRDIINCLAGLTDSNHERIEFALLWVDDVTFLVGARITAFQYAEDLFMEHGTILRRALEGRFCNGEIIRPLIPSQKPTNRSVWNLWGLLESNKSNETERPNKRRRIS